LRDIAESLVNNEFSVQIHASTLLDREIKAAVNVYDKSVDIAVNLAYAKTLKRVIDLLAHELAHVRLNTEDDNHPEFRKEFAYLQKEIALLYDAKGGA